MCGRFNLRTPARQLMEIFSLVPRDGLDVAQLTPRFNIAPTQPIAAVRQAGPHRELSAVRWGLIPSWAKDMAIGNRLINARGETVATKPSFRSAFKKRRCLILADGFYEWKATGDKRKQPYHIFRRDHEPLAFAGLWECWHTESGDAIETATIVTTEANGTLQPLHDRMPVILDESAYDAWLGATSQDAERLQELLRPCPDDVLEFEPIGLTVNNPRNETPDCLVPAGAADES